MLSFFAFLSRHFYFVCFGSAQQTNNLSKSICEDVERSRNVNRESSELGESKIEEFDNVNFMVVERSRNDISRSSEMVKF